MVGLVIALFVGGIYALARSRRRAAETEKRVVVADVEMPFSSMVVFMVKWAIASIPAMLILMAIVALAFVAFTTSILALVR